MHTQTTRTRIISLLIALALFILQSLPATGHFILPMQVDRQGYSANIEFIQWYEGFENTGEPPADDVDVSGITVGRVVMNVYLFDRSFQPINDADVQLSLRSDEVELGPWTLDMFGEGSYTTTEEIPQAAAWDAHVQFEIPEESTPVTARFTGFEIFEADGEAAGSVISDPSDRSSPIWVWVIGSLSVAAILGLIIFLFTYGRKHGKSQKEQAEQASTEVNE